MKTEDLTVEVSCKLSVDKQQAYRAIKILEWYLSDNSNERLQIERDSEGNTTLILVYKNE